MNLIIIIVRIKVRARLIDTTMFYVLIVKNIVS